jgi:hypothetical protein
MTHSLAIAQLSFPVAPPKLAAALFGLLLTVLAVHAQTTANNPATPVARPADLIIEGVNESDVLTLGKTVQVQGTIKKGVVALGGDVIVVGRVEGDVGTVGGNVFLRPGAYIGGDIMVLGGAYQAENTQPEDRAGRTTLVFAGYEQELRDLMLNPVSLLRPHWSPAYVGQRLLAILFWFIVSLLLTAISPGAVSRAVERLRLTSPRVALIGLLGAVVVFFGVGLCMNYLPTAISAILGAMMLVVLLMAYVFGRVALHAATGRWLQRVIFPNGNRSESFALLFGVCFWTIILSLPFIWPLLVTGLIITSLGLALTARYRLGWKRSVAA